MNTSMRVNATQTAATRFKGAVVIGCAVASLLATAPASAVIITGQNGFGTIGIDFSPCKFLSKPGAFATGEIVSGSDWTGGCVGYYSVALDTLAKTISLTGLEVGNYDSAAFAIDGIVGETITGVSMFGPNNLFDPNAYSEFATGVPDPVITFTGSSMRIEWSTIGNNPPDEQFAFSGTGGTTVFSYTSRADEPEPVPIPPTLLLVGLGMASIWMSRRKNKAAKA